MRAASGSYHGKDEPRPSVIRDGYLFRRRPVSSRPWAPDAEIGNRPELRLRSCGDGPAIQCPCLDRSGGIRLWMVTDPTEVAADESLDSWYCEASGTWFSARW